MSRSPLERAGITEPAKDSSYRSYFDNARHPAEGLSVAISALFHAHQERFARQLQDKDKAKPITPDMVMDVGEKRVKDLVWSASRADGVMSTISEASPQDRTRLRLHNIFASQLLLVPVLFKFPTDNTQAASYRGQLLDGIYGEVAEYADYLMNKIKATDAEEKGKAQSLIGALGEVVTLGIGNRSQSADRCYLPALHAADMEGTDVDFLGYTENTTSTRYTGIQVKAYRLPLRAKFSRATGKCLLDAWDLSLTTNCPPFYKNQPRTSAHAMILETNGAGDTPLGLNNVTAETGLNMLEANVTRITLDHSIEYPATFA